MPAMNVYVVSHENVVSTYYDKKYSEKLSTALDSVKADYIKGFHFSAGYDR